MAKSPKPEITAIIFDVDGLLLDTEGSFDLVFAEFARHHGKSEAAIRSELPALRARMLGKPYTISAKLFLDWLNQGRAPVDLTVETFKAKRESLLEQHFATVAAMPGAKELVTTLHDLGLPLAIATSSSKKLHDIKTSRHRDWFQHFSAVTTVENLGDRPGKPAPDIFLIAAEKLGISPQECLVFEDAYSGVKAAFAAGMSVVAALNERTSAADRQEIESLAAANPERVLVVKSLTKFNPHDFQWRFS